MAELKFTKHRGGWRSRGRGSTMRPISSPSQIHVRMENIASVSRSSGLEKDGDILKDHGVQQEYRDFIQQKLVILLEKHTWKPGETDNKKKARADAQENLMILFRKLREGISSSRRCDHFALEVYETSLYLSTLFELPRQTSSIIPHLLLELYVTSTLPHSHRLLTILISLAHQLCMTYPSQGLFFQHLDTIPLSFLPHNSGARRWILSVASSLRSRNYSKFEALTRKISILHIFDQADIPYESVSPLPLSPQANDNLAPRAFFWLVDTLRTKARMSSWNVIRSVYRELSCSSGSQYTINWLTRSLCLQSLLADELNIDIEQWLEKHRLLGHVRAKEGIEGRWILMKPPITH